MVEQAGHRVIGRFRIGLARVSVETDEGVQIIEPIGHMKDKILASFRFGGAVVKSLERILAWEFDRIILSHGDVVERGGKTAFRRAFAWLLG